MSDDTKALKLTVGEILCSALQRTNPRYCAGDFTRWGRVEADINAAIDADRDALAERCEKLREALVRVRAHTPHLWDAERDLLVGLLASIERITDAALRAAPKDAP